MGAVETDDLEALFDQVAAQSAAASVAPVATVLIDPVQLSAEPPPPEEVFQRIGSLTRNLHDALRELGYDKDMENAVGALPDARDRLAYIADLTGKAAERALGAVEQGQQFQHIVEEQAKNLSAKWERVFAADMSLEDFKTTAIET